MKNMIMTLVFSTLITLSSCGDDSVDKQENPYKKIL